MPHSLSPHLSFTAMLLFSLIVIVVDDDVDVVIARIDNEELADLTAKLGAAKGPAEVKAAFTAEVQRLKGAGKVKDGELKNLE